MQPSVLKFYNILIGPWPLYSSALDTSDNKRMKMITLSRLKSVWLILVDNILLTRMITLPKNMFIEYLQSKLLNHYDVLSCRFIFRTLIKIRNHNTLSVQRILLSMSVMLEQRS